MVIFENLENVIPESIKGVIDEGIVNVVVGNLGVAARDYWRKQAQATLFTTRGDYISGIQPVRMEPFVSIVTLVGTLPNIVENGMPRTDLRDTLLGPTVPVVPTGQRGKHKGKDGKHYRSIPFRHGTPGSAGRAGQPMGRPYRIMMPEKQWKDLGKQIHKMAKDLEPGEKLPEGLAPILIGGLAGHKVDIYAGMIKAPMESHAKYITFRTISEGDTDGWIRPSTIPGVQLAKKTASHIARIAPQAFEEYIKGIIGG